MTPSRPAPARRGGDADHLGGHRWAVNRDSRDTVQAPTKGGLTLDDPRLRRPRRRLAVREGDRRHDLLQADLVRPHPVGPGRGRLRLRLVGRTAAAVRAVLSWAVPNSIRSFKVRRGLSRRRGRASASAAPPRSWATWNTSIPLPFNIRAAGFFDIGNVYGFTTKFDLTETREAAGAGVRWQSPFGPIRVDYGINLDRRKGEDFGAIQFSVGSPF